MKLLIRLTINTFALAIVAYLVPRFTFTNLFAIIVSAVVIGIINTFIKPILQLIALPISIITFGIAAFLINVLLLWGASTLVPGFSIDGFFTAVTASIVLSLVSWFLSKLEDDGDEDNKK